MKAHKSRNTPDRKMAIISFKDEKSKKKKKKTLLKIYPTTRTNPRQTDDYLARETIRAATLFDISYSPISPLRTRIANLDTRFSG